MSGTASTSSSSSTPGRAPGGRPQGVARRRLQQALGFVSADFETLAHATGLPADLVRQTLYNMRRSRVAERRGAVRSPANPRSMRLIYGPASAPAEDPGAALASTLCNVWR